MAFLMELHIPRVRKYFNARLTEVPCRLSPAALEAAENHVTIPLDDTHLDKNIIYPHGAPAASSQHPLTKL